MAELLRANPPAPASPVPDLWARLEARIRSEGYDAPSTLPQANSDGAWTWEWRSFARSFGTAMVPVAAVVACFVLVMHNNVERAQELTLREKPVVPLGPERRSQSGAVAGRVVVRIMPTPASPRQPLLVAKERAAVAAVSPKTISRPPAARAEPVVRVAAREPLREVRRHRIRLELQQPPLVAAAEPGARRPAAKTLAVAAARPVELSVKAGVALPKIEEAAVLQAIRTDAAVRGATDPGVYLVAWKPDNLASERDVPADSVADVMEQLRRHQNLFSYGDQ
jgi:hypothetical protein